MMAETAFLLGVKLMTRDTLPESAYVMLPRKVGLGLLWSVICLIIGGVFVYANLVASLRNLDAGYNRNRGDIEMLVRERDAIILLRGDVAYMKQALDEIKTDLRNRK